MLTLLFPMFCVDYKGGSVQTVEVVAVKTDSELAQRWPRFLLFDWQFGNSLVKGSETCWKLSQLHKQQVLQQVTDSRT